jgi:hypothetical protein
MSSSVYIFRGTAAIDDSCIARETGAFGPRTAPSRPASGNAAEVPPWLESR